MDISITIGATTYHVTESDLRALTLRFEVTAESGIRPYLVDGVQVTEAEAQRAYDEALRLTGHAPPSVPAHVAGC